MSYPYLTGISYVFHAQKNDYFRDILENVSRELADIPLSILDFTAGS